ncbi:hypothetical protein RJ640_026000 [Escallonia rubra]|uniref:Uncharacterized protein n=1 Tax=Escallonia rubra TaxID=112253 RepID=A0AA88S4M0_9ASTE|nr:hypothetical protein RJ640_026000 [Escallonia rubra]
MRGSELRERDLPGTLDYSCMPAPPPAPAAPYNLSFFDRALGSDCERLGIKVSNSTSSTDGGNQATSFLPGKFHWVSILLMSGAMALWS